MDKKVKRKRNNEQCKLYWCFVRDITKWLNSQTGGWTEDDTHRMLKAEYYIDIPETEVILRRFVNKELTLQQLLIELMEVIDDASTTKLNETEFAHKLTRIQRDYAKQGLALDSINNAPLFQY